MAYTVEVNLQMAVKLTELFADTQLPASVSRRLVSGDNWAYDLTLSSTSTGASQPEIVTKATAFIKTLSGGAATIDLTSLTDTLGAAMTFLGLKVQAAIFINPSSNANAITISEGASNGYELMGNAFTVALQPGQALVLRGFEATPDVGASAKTIDLAGTGSQLLYCVLAAG